MRFLTEEARQGYVKLLAGASLETLGQQWKGATHGALYGTEEEKRNYKAIATLITGIAAFRFPESAATFFLT